MFTVIETDAFVQWLDALRDGLTRLRLVKRLAKVQGGLLGDVGPVGEDVFEMREHFGPGWRMYFIQQGRTIIVMLGGGDKSTQRRDIERAKALALEWRNEQDQNPSL